MRGVVMCATVFTLAACGAESTPNYTLWDGYSEGELEWVAPAWEAIVNAEEPDGGVLFVGDSITQSADFRTLFPGVATSNHGIAADRTEGVLKRMELVTRGTPEKIFLMIGTNDLHQEGADPEAVGARVGDILDALAEREPQANLHVVGITPRQADMAEAVARANHTIAREAERRGVVYLDLTALMSDETGKIRDDLTYDDLHFNAEGYAVFADALRPCVMEDCEGGYWGRVTPLGRHAIRDGAMRIGWPGSGLRYKAVGSSVIRLRDSGQNQFDLIVNGKRQVVTPEAGVSELEVDGIEGEYAVALIKRSESFDSGMTDILSVVGDVRPDHLDGPRILFIGDSITAGFGTIGADETCGYEIETSSVGDAYALMAAEQLGADAHIVAISGRGAIYNYDDNPEPHMLGHFDLALPDTLGAWDHSRWTPDAVVVALGTNDFSTIDPGTGFAGNYATLLNRIASEYPTAQLFSVTGPLLTDERGVRMRKGIEEGISRVAKRGVEVELVELSLAEEGHKWGCNYHPGPDSNRRMANDLVEAIISKTGWKRSADG